MWLMIWRVKETLKVAANSNGLNLVVGHASFTGIDGWLCNKCDLSGEKNTDIKFHKYALLRKWLFIF